MTTKVENMADRPRLLLPDDAKARARKIMMSIAIGKPRAKQPWRVKVRLNTQAFKKS